MWIVCDMWRGFSFGRVTVRASDITDRDNTIFHECLLSFYDLGVIMQVVEFFSY